MRIECAIIPEVKFKLVVVIVKRTDVTDIYYLQGMSSLLHVFLQYIEKVFMKELHLMFIAIE